MTMQVFISNETVLQGSNCQIWFPSIHETQRRTFFGIINIHNGVIEGKNLFELLSTWVHRKTWDGNMLGLLKQKENGSRDVFRVEDVSGHSRHGSLTFLHSSKVLAWDAKGKQSWNSICLKSKSDQDREDNLPAKLLVIKLVSTKLGCTVLTRTPLPATY